MGVYVKMHHGSKLISRNKPQLAEGVRQMGNCINAEAGDRDTSVISCSVCGYHPQYYEDPNDGCVDVGIVCFDFLPPYKPEVIQANLKKIMACKQCNNKCKHQGCRMTSDDCIN